MTREKIEVQRLIMLNIDPPNHSKVRGIVSRGFTPKSVNSLRDTLAEKAERIVAEAKAHGGGDFVTQVACELPLQAIAELLGIPQDDRHKVFDWSNQMVAYDDPEYSINPEAASVELLGYAWHMSEERKKCPADDIVTKLVNADIDGEALGSDEFGFFVLLLAVAGNETTRNCDQPRHARVPDQPRPVGAVQVGTARRPRSTRSSARLDPGHVVPAHRHCSDTVLGGAEIKKGDRVGMFYSSANFDTDVFDAPDTLRHHPRPEPAPGLRRHRARTTA